MQNCPTRVRLFLSRSTQAGLFAVVSQDLPDLMTVGETVREVEDRLPKAIRHLIKAQYGVDVSVDLGNDFRLDDFDMNIQHRVAELKVA